MYINVILFTLGFALARPVVAHMCIRMKLLKTMSEFYITNPVKNSCRQIDVIKFLTRNLGFQRSGGSERGVMGGSTPPENSRPINFVLYIGVPYDDYARKKKITKNKIMIDTFLWSHTKITLSGGGGVPDPSLFQRNKNVVE